MERKLEKGGNTRINELNKRSAVKCNRSKRLSETVWID